jgi:hypothetical protein
VHGLHSLEGYFVVKPLWLWRLCRSKRKWGLPALALLALSVALGLSLPGMNAWAWHQSPVSPVSPVSPTPTQPLQTPVTITPVPSPGNSPASDTSQIPGSGGTATLVVGGIVLVGLILGAVVLLMRGQPSDELI